MTLKSIAKRALFFALAIVFGRVTSLGAWPAALVEGNVIQIINRSNDNIDRVVYVDELDSSKDARHQKTLSMSGTISRDDLRTYFKVVRVTQPYIWLRSAKYPSEFIRHNVATTNLAEVPSDLQFTLQSLPSSYDGSDFMNNLVWEKFKIVNDGNIQATRWDGASEGFLRAGSDFGGNPQLLSTKSHLGTGYETDWAYSLAFVQVPTVSLPDAIKEGNVITMNTPRGYVVVDGVEGKWLSFDATALPTDIRTQFKVARVEGSFFWLRSVKYPSELIRHTPKGDNKGADYTVGSAVPNQPYSGTDWTNNLRWERFRLDKGKYIMTTRWDGSQTEPGGYIRASGSSFNLIRTHNVAINDYASMGEAFTFAVATVPAPTAVVPAGVATGKNVAIKLTVDSSYLSTPGTWVEATGTKDIKAVGVPFVVTVNSDYSLSFMAQNGKYLSALDNWVLSAEATSIGDREKFIFSDNKLYSVGMHAYVTKTVGTDIRTHAPTDVANYLRAQAMYAVALSIEVIAAAGTGMVWGTLTDGRVVVRDGVIATAPGGTGWSVFGGKALAKVAMGWDSKVYGVESGGAAWYRTNVTANALGGTDWAQFPGVSAVSITAGPNGTLWHCVGDGKAYFGLYSGAINSVGAWEPVHNTLAKISAGPNGHVFALDTTGKVVYRTGISPTNLKGTDWYIMPNTNFASIAAGPNGCAWALKSDQTVWFLKDINATWEILENGQCYGTYISVGADGSVWMSQASGDVWIRVGITSSVPIGTAWVFMSGGTDFNVASIAVGPVAPITPAPTIATTVAPKTLSVATDIPDEGSIVAIKCIERNAYISSAETELKTNGTKDAPTSQFTIKNVNKTAGTFQLIPNQGGYVQAGVCLIRMNQNANVKDTIGGTTLYYEKDADNNRYISAFFDPTDPLNTGLLSATPTDDTYTGWGSGIRAYWNTLWDWASLRNIKYAGQNAGNNAIWSPATPVEASHFVIEVVKTPLQALALSTATDLPDEGSIVAIKCIERNAYISSAETELKTNGTKDALTSQFTIKNVNKAAGTFQLIPNQGGYVHAGVSLMRMNQNVTVTKDTIGTTLYYEKDANNNRYISAFFDPTDPLNTGLLSAKATDGTDTYTEWKSGIRAYWNTLWDWASLRNIKYMGLNTGNKAIWSPATPVEASHFVIEVVKTPEQVAIEKAAADKLADGDKIVPVKPVDKPADITPPVDKITGRVFARKKQVTAAELGGKVVDQATEKVKAEKGSGAKKAISDASGKGVDQKTGALLPAQGVAKSVGKGAVKKAASRR